MQNNQRFCQIKLIQIIDKSYEARSIHQHQYLKFFLLQNIPQIYTPLSNILLFFTIALNSKQEIRNSNEAQHQQTLVILSDNQKYDCLILSLPRQLQLIPQDMPIIVIFGKDIQKAKLMQSKSIQQEVKALYSYKHFQNSARKDLFQFIKMNELLCYKFSQTVYHQKESLNDNSGCAYLVRKGVFVLNKFNQISKRNHEVYEFTCGHIFGIQQYFGRDGIDLRQKDSNFHNRARIYTVKCKSSEGYIYKIPFQKFRKSFTKEVIKILSEEYIHLCHLTNQMMEKIDQRQPQSNQSANSLYPSMKPSIMNSALTKYQDIAIQQPKKQKKFDKMPLIKRISESEIKKGKKHQLDQFQYKQLGLILKKREVCSKVRGLVEPSLSSLTRGEVLFGLLKTSWRYERQKQMSILK